MAFVKKIIFRKEDGKDPIIWLEHRSHTLLKIPTVVVSQILRLCQISLGVSCKNWSNASLQAWNMEPNWLLSLQPLSVLLEDNKQSGSPLNISVCLRGDLRLLQQAGHRDDMIPTHLEYFALWKASTFAFVSLLHLFMRLFEFLMPLVNIQCAGSGKHSFLIYYWK